MNRAWKGTFWVVMTCAGLAGHTGALAQLPNAWINFSQSYYKIPVAKNGIYRLSYADLQAAGIPIGAVDPRRINLMHRGIEQSIFIQGQSDATFDPSDYIEFFGERNDGTLDTDLYSSPALQPHKYYNLFNDTAAYFLTWNALPVPGKRMNTFFELNNTGLPKETFHNAEQLRVYFDQYSGGYTELSEIQGTVFDQGEGWTGTTICTILSGCVGFQDQVITQLTHPTSGASPQLEINLVGRNEHQHQAEIYAGQDPSSLRLLTTANFIGFQNSILTLPLIPSDISSSGTLIVRVRILPTSIPDLISISSIKVTFPQNFDMNSMGENFFNLTPNATNKSYIEVLNQPSGARIWDITDKNNVGFIGTIPVSGGLGAVVAETSNARKLYVTGTTLTTSLRKVSFRSLSAKDFVIISHRSLMKPALAYGDPVQAYAAYRASTAGGGYDTLVVGIDQLYNQFNYGETSPRAIFQFMRFITSGGHPRYLFLIGKGLEVSNGFYRKTSVAPTDFRDLVPPAGMPGSDIAYTAGLAGTLYEPAVPTGRLTASTPLQVAIYLNKVKESESLPFTDLWRKDLLHLSGGINAGEPELFRSYVDGFKAVAEDFYLGGSVQTISKQTLNVELVNVKEQVNKGLDLITFFGHSGPGTIDIDIGFVSDPTLGYNNAGKYPGFLINGCNAGRFFDNRFTFGEDWMLTANKGAKAFIAHSYFGFSNFLKLYSDTFYAVAFGDSLFLHKGIGDVQKEVAKRFIAATGTNLSSITQAQQMVLLGDPAVVLFGASKPDYAVNNGSISMTSLDGKPITAQSSSFAVDVQVKNFGRAQPGPLKLRVIRTLSDNSTVSYDSIFNPVKYSDVLRVIIKKGRNNNEFGTNKFNVVVDADGTIPELDESNNEASLNFFIPLNGTKNLFPGPYAIVATSTTNIIFQHTDITSGTRTFKIEIDTAATFDSPFLKRQTLNGKVLAKTNLTLFADDSLVYYWRTRIDKPLAGESNDWVTSSFVHIVNSPEGWAQLKFPQLTEDPVVGLNKNPDIKRLEFLETVTAVNVKAYGNANPTSYALTSIKINGNELNVSPQRGPCRNNTINLVAFDRGSAAPYPGIIYVNFFDPRACGLTPLVINNFLPTEVDTGLGDDLVQYVTNVHQGDSVVLFSIGDAGYASWSTNVKNKLGELGIAVNQLSALQPGEPFVIYGKKGAAAGTAKIFRTATAPADAQELDVSKTITGRVNNGTLGSVTIGPAQQWSQLVSQVTQVAANDVYSIDVIGIDQIGNEIKLMTGLSGVYDLSSFDAKVFPFLRLALKAEDQIDLTPVQLKKWIVKFTPSPEGILTYAGQTATETLQEGQEWKANYGFTNISSRTFSDSLLVNVDLFSNTARSASRQTFKIKQPKPGDTTKFAVTVKTVGKAGSNDVTVFVNPRQLPEMYYDNNTLSLYGHLNVEADKNGPILDVTVDGRHVSTGDAVAASPVITMKVIDGNAFLLKKDTVGVDLYIKAPCPTGDCPYKRINFSQKDVEWTPATATTDFQLKYHPASLAVGAYSLKADASDASGNLSGDEPYEVSFIVTDKDSFVFKNVSPNPSPDNFHFNFYLAGPEIPDDFSLKIYSPTGGLIKSYGSAVIDQLHVGTNDIIMDSNDAAGVPFGSGVYVYRMTVLMGGKVFTQSGRLVVMR
jgi:hypothetical protein